MVVRKQMYNTAYNTQPMKIFPFNYILLFTIGIAIFSILVLSDNVWGQTSSPLITSSRGFFNTTTGGTLHNTITSLPNASSIFNPEADECPNEIAIYVHGVWTSEEDAKEQIERIDLSLKRLNYSIPMIGFSWDSNTTFSLQNQTLAQEGWQTAKFIANKNGALLGKFIADLKEACPDTDLRLVAHSLGARVVFSALQFLQSNEQHVNITDNDTSKRIETVHLLGAAVDDEQVSTSHIDCVSNFPPLGCSGKDIEAEVNNLFNLYNSEDNLLAPSFSGTVPSVYETAEDDDALGAGGAEDILSVPDNYNETDVRSRILIDIDANGDRKCDLPIYLGFGFQQCSIISRGDNHMGYLGFRNADGNVYDTGVIDVVVEDWFKN
jgi:Alpha/beta hydrolase of unknown function (DUF900)